MAWFAAFWLGGMISTAGHLFVNRDMRQIVLEHGRSHPVRCAFGVLLAVLMWPAFLQLVWHVQQDEER